MIPLDIFDTLTRIRAYGDLAGYIIAGIIIGGILLYWLWVGFKILLDRVVKYKYYVKVYTNSPQMLLDRKWGVKYRKHIWNKWKYYKPENHKYYTDFTNYEARVAADDIKKGKIKL